MAKGIVVKVWNVKAGNGTRSAASQISDSIDYIENPEKTGIPLNITSESQLGNELTYVTNEVKTEAGLYVGCRHISDISHATDEMMQVKQFYGKLDGRVATHGIVSLDASESDPRNAGKLMEIGERLAKEYNIPYLPSDFKKKNGYKRSIELSREYDLYRQNYCGCVFSRQQAEKEGRNNCEKPE